VILTAFLLGPASGLALAIHLAHSGHDHHGDNCPVCIQLTVGSAAPVVEQPTLFTPAESSLLNYPLAAQVLALSTCERAPLAARAPPPAC